MSITGTWYNELGSQLYITASGGQIHGNYYTAVGQAKYLYSVMGQYDTSPNPSGGQAMSWTVVWNNAYGNSHSTTAWSGQYHAAGGSNEEIYTLWLLASEVRSENDDWSSTKVGQDTFTRTPPSADVVERTVRRGHAAHPKAAHPPTTKP